MFFFLRCFFFCGLAIYWSILRTSLLHRLRVCSLHSSITLLSSFSRSQAPTVVLNKILVSLETLKALPCKNSSRCLYKTKASWEVFCSVLFDSQNLTILVAVIILVLAMTLFQVCYSSAFSFNIRRMWHDLPQKYSFILKHKWLWGYLKANTINYDAFKLIKTCSAAVSIKTWDRQITCAWTSITCDCWGSSTPPWLS